MINVLQAALAALSGKAALAAAGVSAAALAVTGVAVSTPDEADEGLGTATEQVEVVTDEADETLENKAEPTITDEGEDAEENSESDADDQGVAKDVHAKLSGNDLLPGDEGFGQAVANNVRNNGGGQFGQSVADAASGGRSAGNQTEAAEDADDVDDGDDDDKRPDLAGPPEGVSPRDR